MIPVEVCSHQRDNKCSWVDTKEGAGPGIMEQTTLLYIFIFLSLERTRQFWRKRCALLTHECISDLRSLWVVKLNSSNLNSELIFLRHETFPACTLGVPTLVLTWLNHNLNQITCSQLAALTMWPSSYQKSAAFWGWSGIFPWEQPREQLSVRVSVCLRTLGENLPPPSLFPLPLFPTNSPLSPLFLPFFHHLPSFETQYHTLDSLCCHGEEHSFLWHGHTECVNAWGFPKKILNKELKQHRKLQ